MDAGAQLGQAARSGTMVAGTGCVSSLSRVSSACWRTASLLPCRPAASKVEITQS